MTDELMEAVPAGAVTAAVAAWHTGVVKVWVLVLSVSLSVATLPCVAEVVKGPTAMASVLLADTVMGVISNSIAVPWAEVMVKVPV